MLALAVLAACAELPELGVCGNGIVEADNGEACDGTTGCTASCEVACGEERTCEEGQTCGVDGVCRAPSGLFAPVGSPQTFDMSSFHGGDFDADGIVDLVGSSGTAVGVLFGSSSGSPLTSGLLQEAPSSDSPPVIYERDVTNPGASKVAIAIPTDGIALMVSDSETLMPRIEGKYPFDMTDKVIVALVDPDAALGDVIVEVTRPAQFGSVDVKRAAIGVVGSRDLDECALNARLVGISVSRDRHSLMLAVRIAGISNQFRLCEYRDLGQAPAKTTVNSAPPDSIILANIDPDRCDEIVIAQSTVVDTTVQFVDVSGADCTTVAGGPTGLTNGVLAGANDLLAAGRVVSPDRDAIVLGNGLYEVVDGVPPTLRPLTPPMVAGRWLAATVTDLDGDGAGDVVASLRDQQNLEVVRGGPQAGLNMYEVSTGVPVTAMRPGDFDGDGYGDAALIESGNGQRVSVLYGRPDGKVEPPRPNSRFQGVLVPAVLRRFGWENTSRGRDGIDDLFLVRTVNDSTPVTTAGVLIGDPSRVMTMPVFPDLLTSVGTLAVGRLDGTTVSAVAVRPVSATASEMLGFDLETQFAPTPVPLPGFAVDATVQGTVLRTAGESLVAILTHDGPRAFDRTGVQCSGAPEGLDDLIAIHAVDVDGDGLDELAVFHENTLQLQVYDVTGGAACAFGPELLVGALDGCIDVARIGDSTVVTCKRTTELPPRLYRLVDGIREATPIADLDGTPGIITPGDYDGDGVTDLAIVISRAGIRSIQFARQCPAHDTRGCR